MSDLLLGFGFCWMVVAAMLGLYLGARHPGYTAKVEVLAKDGALLDYHQTIAGFRWFVTVHAHGFLFSVVCILTALTMQGGLFPAAHEGYLVVGLISSTVIWFFAALLKLRALMGIADFIFLGVLVAMAVEILIS